MTVLWEDASTRWTAQKRAQSDYVRKWRAEHPDEVYAAPWMCPLCNEAIQNLRTSAYYGLYEHHKNDHGADWLAYEAASSEPAGAAAGEM